MKPDQSDLCFVVLPDSLSVKADSGFRPSAGTGTTNRVGWAECNEAQHGIRTTSGFAVLSPTWLPGAAGMTKVTGFSRQRK
jgi:hypothetical protein